MRCHKCATDPERIIDVQQNTSLFFNVFLFIFFHFSSCVVSCCKIQYKTDYNYDNKVCLLFNVLQQCAALKLEVWSEEQRWQVYHTSTGSGAPEGFRFSFPFLYFLYSDVFNDKTCQNKLNKYEKGEAAAAEEEKEEEDDDDEEWRKKTGVSQLSSKRLQEVVAANGGYVTMKWIMFCKMNHSTKHRFNRYINETNFWKFGKLMFIKLLLEWNYF